MKNWMKVNPSTFAINRNAGKIVVGDEDFEVWGLGKSDGTGVTWADITRREGGYEIALGRKFRARKFKKFMPTSRDVALKSLIKEMRKFGKI